MCECAHIRRDKMKNTRTTQQTKIKKCMRWTASGLLLAVLFVLVFAGTLSGAFGIEKIADAGSPIDVSSISVSGTNIGNAFNTNNDSNKSKFYLSGNGDIASHFGYNTSANGGWGFTDWNAGSNNPQVYWLEFKFSGDALTAVQQGRVSYYASAKGDFSDGTNDEYGMAISYMGDHSAPQAGWVDGSGEKWKTTNNLVEYQGFSNDNSKTFTFGQIGSFAEKYAISTTATGIRLIFAAIPDGNIDGGFKEINFTLYMKPNDTVSSTGTTFDVSDGFYGENYKISANSTSNWSNLSDNESGNGIKTSGTKEYSGSDPLNVGEGHNYDFNIGTTNSGVAITYMSKPDKYSYTGSIDVSIVIPAYTTSVSISADVYTSTTAHRSRATIFNTFYVPKNDSTATVSILDSNNQVFSNTAKSVSSAMAKHEKSDDSNNKCGLAVVEHLAYSSTITTDASDQAKTIKVRLTLNASKEDQAGTDDEQLAFALLTNLQISFKGQYFVELNSSTSPNFTNRQTFVYGTSKSLPTRSELGWTNGENTFTGWGTVSDGVVKYANGYNTGNGEFTNKPGATIKLYAIWVGSDFSHYDDRAADSTWGSKNNPFLITSDEEWKNLIDIVNGARDPVNSVTGTYYETVHSTAASDTKFSNCYFVLTSNLGSQDEPIGLTSIGLNTSNYFAGNIRGGNGGNFNNTNTVRVLYIDIYQESDYCGLFGYAKNASISFLEVSGAIDANDDYVGGILGYGDNVSVSNCKNDIDITSVTYDDLNNPTYYNYIGGIAGYLVNGAISNCANSGSIGGASNVGGIVGSAQASVSYCANIGGVITGIDYVGGIVGTSTSTVDHCYDVAGQRSVRQANGRIGAITGSGGTVTDSWAINEVARTGQTTTNVSTAHRTVSASTFNVSPLLNLSDTTNGAWTDIITQNIDGFKISGKTTNGTYLYLNNGSNSIVSPDKMDGDTAVNSITNTAITKTSGIGFALYYGANKNSNINAELRDISTSISNLTYDGKLHSATNISLPTGYDPIANFYFVRDNNGNPTGNPTDDGRTNAGNYYVISEARFAVSGTTYVVGRKVISNNWVISKRAITLKQTHFEYFYGENVTAKAEYNNVVNGHIVKMTTPYVNFYAGIDSNLGYKDYVVTSTDVKIYIDGTDTDVSKNYSIAEAKITIRINEGDFGVQGTDDIANNPWGSVNNPYLIRTQTQLERLAQIVASGDARNSVRTADFPYVKAQKQQNKQDFANCYFKLTNDLSMSYTSLTYSNHTSNPGGYDGQVVGNLFDNNTNSKLFVTQSSVSFEFEVNVATKVYSYSFNVANDTGNSAELKTRNPKSFKLEGYNGSNWVVIDERENTKWSTTNFDLVTIINMNGAGRDGSYSKFRVTSSSSGTNGWQISEFRINNPLSGSNPIGTSSAKFAGTFDGGKVDGGSYTISNLKTYGYDYSGLFGYVQGGTIKNVNLANLTVNNNGGKYHGGIAGELNGGTIEKCNVNGWVWGNEYIGGIVGRVSGASTISNCTTSSGSQINFNGGSDTTRPRVGGIVGGMDGNGTFSVTISGCVNNAKINNANNGTYGFGGIVGYNSGQTVNISGCTNNAEINGKSETGGIIGYTDNSAIQNCTNNGVVKGADNVGGIVGKICAGEITACENTKEVTAVSAIGGIVGFATSLTINGATNSGTITGTGGQVAGIVGYSDANGRMYGVVKNSGAINGGGMVGGIGGEYHGYWCDASNNYGSFENSGAINGGSGSAIGGITGFADKEILSAVNKGNVIGGSAVGGIAGRCQAPVKNSYNEANIQGTVAINPGTTEVSGNPKGVYVGGIVGYTSAAATILHCYNTGNIKACNADGTYLGSSNYVGGIVGFAQADVSYCANIRGIIEGNDYIGGIVGKSTSTIYYCYDVEGQRILRYVSGRIGAITGDAGTVDYSWAVNEKTYSANLNSTATPNPTISTRGHWLTTAFAITPLAIDNGSYNEKVWTDILTQDINGFKVVGSVAANNFFVTDNGKDVSDSNYKYVKPLTTEGFTGDIGSVTVRYSATTDSDIRAHAEAITLPTASTVYNGSEQGFGHTTYPNTQNGAAENTPIVYTSSFVYLENHKESSPTQVYVYDVTVTIKINGQIVGKTSATYTITPCEIEIKWTWTEYATANNGLSAEFEYNALAQGLASVDLAGYDSQFNVTGSDEKIIPAGDYSRTYTLIDERNYVIKNNNSNTITFRWKINAYNIKLHLENGEVWFGGIAGNNGLIVGNQLTSVISGTTRGGDSVNVDYYPLQVDVKGTSGVQQVLVYAQNPSDTSQKLYTASHFVLYVKYNDGTVTKIDQGTDYDFGTLNNDNGTVGAFKEDLVSNTNPVVDTNVTARGKVNFTGDITRYYTALYSDFGGNVTSAGWGSSTNNPYVIDRPEYLLRLSQIVNGGMAWNSINTTDTTNLCYAPQSTATATDRSYAGAYFKLVLGEEYKVWDDADHTKFHYTLDMSDYVSTDGITNLLPIGRIDNSTSPAREFPFSGTFDGGWTEGHKNVIDYIYNIDSDSFKNNNGIRKDYIGLFGYTDGATITNFTLNCTSGEISGNDYVGFVVGYAKNSTIYDVKCEYGKKVNGNDYVGGVAGKAEGTTIKCSEGNRVYNGSVQGREYVGGIVGMWIVTKAEQIGGSTSGQASITPVGRSEVDGFRYVGGLVGYLDASGCDLLQFKPSFDNGTYKENNVTYNNLTVQGTEYVGALFGVLIGNGYHKEVGETISTAIIIDAKNDNNGKAVPCVHNVNLNIVNYGTGDNIVAPKVVGGLIGYIESAGLIFNTSYYTSSIKFDFGVTTPSVLGGVVGILGKNATIENCTVQKPDGTDLISGNYTLTNDVAFGSTSKAFGSFVGGIAGFVSSQAGTAYETSTVGTTYIFGNAVHLVNAAEIYATGFAGGLFGATGDVNSKLLSGIGEDTDLFVVLTTGVRKGQRATTNLGVAPSVKSPFVKSAAGKMQNTKNVSVTDSYVGGLIGYVGDKVTLTLTNNERSTTLEKLNIFSGSSSSIVSIHGSYAGGLVGYLSASAHRFEYIAVQAQLGDTKNPNYKYVGGLVGYMANGTIEHCVATNNKTTYNSDIDNFKGADFVGGLVGYVLSATINNSFTSGFNFASTSGTKGGIIGAGQQPNISSSWTIYVAQSGATYENASKNQYGKYISFDDDIDNYNVDSITEAVFKFAGFGGATTTLDFKVKVPNKNSDNKIENKQLVFYDASGDDEVTKNYLGDDYNSVNDVLTFSLNAESATSMQVYVKKIQFVNIPKHNTSGDDSAKAVVKEAYRKPSTSDRYDVIVNTAVFDITGTNPTYQILSISGVVLFDGKIVGSTIINNTVGNFAESFTLGSIETPYTISNITEWNLFAEQVRGGKNFSGDFVRLLVDLTGVTSANLAGASGKPFAGTFDGNGHTISIGTISSEAAGTSLFPYAKDATFKNLTVTGTITSSASGIAGFVGSAGGSLTFENCKNQVAITGGGNLGGLVGETYADENSANDSFTYTFVDCVNEANIEGSNVKDTSGVGGIVGNVRTGGGSDAVDSSLIQSKVDLESCRNKGNITGKYNVAGIFGREGGNATVKNCANTGNITAYGADGKNGNRTSGDDTYAAGIGGLITDNAKIDVFASYNKGNVLGWGNKAGGILAADCSYDQSGSTSKIYYCYNTGNVTTGGSSPQTFSAANVLRSYGGMAGGILGGMVNADIQYCYNTGEITANGIIGVELNWTYRLGGIVGYSDGVSNSSVKYTKIIKNCYNVGIIRVGARGTAGDVGVGVSPILGSHVNTSSDSYSLPVMANNYSLKDCVRHKDSSGNEWAASARAVKKGSNSNTQWEDTAKIDYINKDINGIAGKIVESVADMTALNTRGNELQTTRTTSTSGYEALGFSSQIGALGNIEGTDGGYIFVYGCLPQLAVFALDTKNGLAMTSKGYGQDLYGEYVKQSAGDQFNPYIIKDGIDLMGLQALVEAGYDFDGKYIEFADGTNNLDKDVVMSIDMSTTQATGYTFTSQNGSGKKGKSYHLYTQGAIFNDAAYNKWSEYNYYATTGGMAENATLDKQNMLPIGRKDTSFKGTLIGSHMVQYSSLTAKEQEAYSGKKYNLTNGNYVETENGTYVLAGNGVVSNLRIASDTYGGLFAKAENATIAYVGIAGNSFVRAYAIGGKSMAGGIVALALGSTTIEHCSLEGAAQVEAYGSESYAGGIVGIADTKQSVLSGGYTYNAGTVLTISGCYVDTSGMVESTNGYIGGIVGYVEGQINDNTTANGKGNTVRIENCAVIETKLQAVAGSEDSHHIGGIIGYGSSYVPAYITGCEVGQVTGKSVNINGEYALGGIAGAMSNAVGGFIDSCSVGAGTTITRTKFGSSVSEDGKYGTAIGGLVGYTEAYETKQVTTTFSGENTFAGTIDVDVPTTSPATTEAFIANIGGIVGDMGDGANFASGSIVVVSGTINVNKSEVDTNKAMNIGGVAGRTNTATFIGTFDVHPTMTSPLAQNVGGFIGKNAGATYVLADISRATDTTLKGTTITIGSSDGNGNYSGSISAASNVGGIIGLNSAGSVFGIGSNNVDGTNYNKGTLHITIYATITGTGNNVGGIVGLNESNTTQKEYGVVSIVRGVIVQNGAISGASYVGGIVGYDNGVLETGGATADSNFSEDNQKLITALSITNKGNVTGSGDYVGGFIGRIDEPRNDQKATGDDVDIAGTFTNDGLVEGGNYVGGLIGYVGKGVTIGTKNDVPTEFKNSKNVVGHGNYIGGSIGLLLGTIKGASTSALVKFENIGNVDGKAYVGGSIGVIAGDVEYAQFINKSDNLTVASADTAVGGSVGYLGVPNTLKDKDEFKNISISVQNSHFEANGTLTVSGTSTGSVVTETGGVGGAIGVIGSNVTTWSGNTYYARGNVTAGGINNVGGIIGLIKAANIAINNMLAYDTTVSGATNVGGIVGATTGADTQIVSAYAIEGEFTGKANVGGIIGLAQPNTVASTSYWVKGYKNSEIATYDVDNLKGLGFTTGTEQTGWFFLYANDANGTGDLGKINTKHSTAAVNNNAPSGAAEASEVQADDAELKYWKRIADAYTASERANGEDDNAKNPLTSTIVKGFGSPQKGTLYATATAALVSSSGYYMYVATSGEVKPTIEYGNVENNVNGYLISVNTVKNGGSATTADDTTEQSADTAGNVAVFYRKITKGEDLVYNGYYRNPIIGLDDVGSYNGVITLDNNGEATVSDYAEKYIYTATTITKDSDNNVIETVFEKPSDPGTYTPTIKIFYVDASGKARLVGGHLGLAWTIKTRELTATFSSESQRTYGDKQDEEGSVDKTITITNIAPNFGKTVPIQVTVSAGEESTTFTWKGSAATKTENGITLTFDALSAGEPFSEKDKSATSAEDLASDSNTYTLVCKIFFKEAKSYSIVVSDGSSQDNKVERYTIKDGTGTFTVNKATLTFQRVSGKPASSAFDGTPKTTEWEVTGFKYQDGDKELAAFLPQFNLQYKNASSASSVNLYSGDKLQDGGINGPTISIGVTAGSKVNFALSSAVRKGEYWISFGKSEAGNYKFEDYDSLKFNIVEVQITVSCSPSNGSKTYDKQAATITITFVASVPSNSGVTDFTGIDNYEQFIVKYFQITGEGSNAKFTVDKPNGTGKKTTVSWKITTGVNADTYTFTPELKSATKTEFEENCSWLLGDSTYQYKIKTRQLTLTTKQTGTSPYTYTYDTYHHGLNEVSLDSQNGEKGLISGDTVIIAISGSVTKPLTFTSGGSQSAGISTIDAGTYTANFALTGNGNYTLSSASIKLMSWTINQYEVKIAKIGLSGSSRPYDGTATTPTITITGVSGSNGTYTYNQDTFTIAYSITKDGTTLANGDKLKNAGRYEIKVGNGNGSIKAHRTNSSSTDTSKNYKFSDTDSIATYEITPLSISIEWNYPTPLEPLVYTGNNQMISIKSITLSDANNTTSKTLEMSSNSVDSGCGNDKLTFTLSGGGTDAGSDHTTTATLSSVIGNTDGIDSGLGNYVLDDTATSGTFTIAKSKLKIEYTSGTASKVYDGDTNVTNNSFTFSVSSTNGGANGSDDMFDKAMTYDNKNVGTDKNVTFTYSLKSGNSNYEYVETNKSQTVSGIGEITPLDIKVILNKLRNNKATRTFRTFINGKAYSYYGGQAGASGNGNSEVYRSGEGFTLSGVIPGDSVNVIAEYKEADEKNRAMFDCYVNNVYKADDDTYKIASANTYFKKLVFTMSGDDAQNYTFNVYTGNKAYSEKSSTAGVTQTLTVYDSRSNVDGQKNVTTAPTIYIEITVKTYKVEYAHTAQSYANADNTYNTDWQRVVASNVPDGVTVTVSNGWMFADGKDHLDSEQAEKRQYTGYTTIRGSQNSVILGAKISGQNGMELNYKMSNQPILTIGYFVAQGDEFEIGSAASLMIASYYWTIAQNKDNPDFNQELVAGSTWHTVVSNYDYINTTYTKPADAPKDIPDNLESWDDYFAAFEKITGKNIFLNETGVSGEDGNWGYYEETETSSSISYTKFKLVRNFSGVLTESDIATLNAFFRVYNKTTQQYESVEWGYGGTYIANFLKSSVSSTLTALGSVFMSVENAATPCEFDGNGYVIEYLNIMGYGKSNVGFFDIVGSNSVVKNLHLRNVTINANQGNVGGIAGSVLAAAEAASESSIANVSFHGTINVDVPTTNSTNGVVGGLVGNSARAIDGAIVLGTITANGAASVGGVVGVTTASISKVVSLMQVTAYSGTVGAFTTTQNATVENSVHMTNAVWLKGTGFVNVDDKNKSYNELMNGSISGYGTSNKYYYAGETPSTKGTYDVLADVKLTKLDAKGSENEANARESMRLKDLVYVYLLMYSLTEDTDSLTENDASFTVKVYKLSSSSWLVGEADGTSAKPVAIANKQNVSLLRQLPFATFTLKTNVTVSISNTFAGAFFGTVESAKNTDGVSLGYKITCNQAMFEAYAGRTPSWLTT